MAVNIRSADAAPLILSALNRGGDHKPLVVRVAEYSDPKPDDGFVVRLLVSFQDGFVWGLAPLPVEMSQAAKEPRFEHVNRAKVLKHCAKLAAGLAPDADILDLSKEGWCFKKA